MAGLILLSQVGGASVTAEHGLELPVVTAVVLGGASLSGGRGGIVGHHPRGAHHGCPRQRPRPAGRPSFWIEVANGVLLLAAVGFDQLRIR